MKYLSIIAVSLCCFLCAGCAMNQQPQMTQLQVREIQTRTFDQADTKTVMKAMINTLQDEGYIVKNAVLDLGLLSAEKDVDVERAGDAIIACLFGDGKWSKHMVMDVSANISESIDGTKVRLNFQMKKFDNWGSLMKVDQVMDDHVYQQFFSKVSKGIFLQEENV